MNIPENDNEIIKLRQIKWRSPLSRKVEEFSVVISDDNVFEKCFGESYTNDLAIKSKAITQSVIKLGIIYAILMLSLYASQNVDDSEFEILGYGFKNIGNYKELLLLLAAVISPISAIYSAYQKYINALIGECLKKLSPDARARKYYSLKFVDEYFAWLPSRPAEATLSWHGFTSLIMASLLIMLVLLFFTLLAGSFFIQINVIYDIAINPSSSRYINIFVLSVSISSILLSWLITIIQFPMPEIDISNYLKLDKIKEEEPVRYRSIMRQMADESARKEVLSTLVYSSLIYMIAFAIVSIFFFPGVLEDLQSFLSKAMAGAFFVLLVSNEVIKFIRKCMLNWFFKNYPEGTVRRLEVFIKVTKIIFLSKILCPLVLALGFSFHILGLISA